MSELQAVLQARRKQQNVNSDSQSNNNKDDYDNDSENAVVPTSLLTSSQPPTNNTTTKALIFQQQQNNNAPSSVSAAQTQHDINNYADGIEVSPSAKGREVLQLNSVVGGSSSGRGGGGPPSMPSPSSMNNVPVRGGHAHNSFYSRGTSSRAISQDPQHGGGGGNTAQDPRGGRTSTITKGASSIKGQNKFGIRYSNPPTDLSP